MKPLITYPLKGWLSALRAEVGGASLACLLSHSFKGLAEGAEAARKRAAGSEESIFIAGGRSVS